MKATHITHVCGEEGCERVEQRIDLVVLGARRQLWAQEMKRRTGEFPPMWAQVEWLCAAMGKAKGGTDGE